jgi:phosphatidylglycerol:prolipoprotein diacylglycerol transferase
VGDQVAFVAPIGLFFGRLANFINGELYGRVTEHPLGIIFPNGGPLPRHPSQLYEAFLEGLVLFAILFFIDRRLSANRTATRPHGILIAVFMIGYGLARMVIEFVREPDAHLGFLFALGQAGISMGQLLSLPMVLFGLCLLIIVRNK